MTHEDMDEVLASWCRRCSDCLAEVYDLCDPHVRADADVFDSLARFVSAQLLMSCHLTSESVTLLVANGKIWDANTLLRSVLEGTFKFVFLLDGTDRDRIQKAEEYWVSLPEMKRVTRHRRAMQLLETFNEADPEWKRPIIDLTISDREERELQAKYSKVDKQRLNQKWSFIEIANYFARHPDSRYHGMAVLAYAYGMQSHLLHQDGDGVGMVWERSRRCPDRRSSVEIAHAGRLISDICHLAFFRLWQLFATAKQPIDAIKNLEETFQPLFVEIDRMGKVWHDIEYDEKEGAQDEKGPQR